MAKEFPKFYVADRKKIDDLADSFNIEYTKEEIVTELDSIRRNMKSSGVRYVDSNDVAVEVPQTVSDVFGPYPKKTFYAMRKQVLAEALAYFNADSRNFDVRKGGAGVKRNDAGKLRDLIAANGMLSVTEVKKLMGNDAVKIDSSYWWSSKVTLRPDIRKFRVFECQKRRSYTRSEKNYYLRLPSVIVNDSIRSVFPTLPEVDDPNPDKDENILTLSRMSAVSMEFSIASAMLDSGVVSLGVTRLVTKSDLKKFRQLLIPDSQCATASLVFKSFGAASDDVSMENVALWAYMFYRTVSHTRNNRDGETGLTDPADIVRNVVLSFSGEYGNYPQVLNMLLPGVSNFTQLQTKTALSSTVTECLRASVMQISGDRWIPVDNIAHDVYRRLYLKNREVLFGQVDDWPEMVYYDGDGGRVPIGPSNAVKHLTFPLVRGYVFFLTALGVLETTIDRNAARTDGDPFCCLKYTRLTPLGKYVIGEGPHVDLTVSSDYIHNYELIDNPMIVVALNPSNPYNGWLNKIGISRGNRWIVTPGSFMFNCDNVHDVENSIEEFKKYICEEPSPVWQAFFDRLIANAGKGSMTQDCERYIVYKVNPDNKELQKFISTDPEIRKMVLRAEDYRILVRQKDFEIFRDSLRLAGYLI